MTFERSKQRFPPRGGGTPQEGSPTQQGAGLPPDYLRNGYFDQKGNPLPEIIIEWPKDIATKLANARPEMKSAQLRNFFGEARHIEGQLSAGQDFESLRGRILQLDSYAASSQTRGNAPLLFKQFIEQNLKWAAKDRKSFMNGFIPHFECVVAYFPKK
jgi:hypothetical protein